MPDTKDGKNRIILLERNMADVNNKLGLIQSDINEIKKCLLGDPDYKIPGIIGEHREMYQDYEGARWFLQHIKEFFIGIIGLVVALIAVIIKLFTEIN
jgi:hypothetical protein